MSNILFNLITFSLLRIIDRGLCTHQLPRLRRITIISSSRRSPHRRIIHARPSKTPHNLQDHNRQTDKDPNKVCIYRLPHKALSQLHPAPNRHWHVPQVKYETLMFALNGALERLRVRLFQRLSGALAYHSCTVSFYIPLAFGNQRVLSIRSQMRI